MNNFDDFLKNKEHKIKQQDASIQQISRSHNSAWFMVKGYLAAIALMVSIDGVRYAMHDEGAYNEASSALAEDTLILPEDYLESLSLDCVEDVYESAFEHHIGKDFDDLSDSELTTIKSQNWEAFEHCAHYSTYSSQAEKEDYVRSLDYSLGVLTVPTIGGGLGFLGLSSYYGLRRRRAEAKKTANVQEMSLFK
jgi:hypothetical protein